jgi:hypothetical protein
VDQEACPLSGEDLAIRLTEFGALFSRALSRERVGERAQFRFSKADEHVLRDLTRREKECCSFWSFDIRADNGDLVLDVGVESPRFAHFVDQFYALGD